MLTVALDKEKTEMRMYCLSELSHAAIIEVLQREQFAFDDLGAFFVIKASLDWKRVVSALGLDPDTAMRRDHDGHVLELKI